jgi:hypothetical protein
LSRNKLISFLGFLLIWLLFSYAVGTFDHLSELPMGVHQGAQCDRASLAQNYYVNGFKFLYPEVNEDKCTDGIVSCEFPLSNYLAACLYKLFGYDEIWFRLLSFAFITLGMYALWLNFRLYLSALTSFLLIFLLNASPIILFYSANFLPDISSVGLMLVAWLLLFRIHIPHSYLPALKCRKWQILMIICLSLGIASKTTSLVQWLTIAAALVLSYIPALKITLLERKKLWISLLSALALPILWFFWSKHLSQVHNSQYFMMRIPHSESLEAYRMAWHIYLGNWPSQTLSEPLIYISVVLFFVVLFLRRYISPALWTIACINFIGSALFLCVMIEQFKYHDYYVICLFPAFALNWMALANAASSIKPKFWWIRAAIFAGLCIAVNMQFHLGGRNLRERYTPGNYWEQSHINAVTYDSFRLQLNAAGINRNSCVLAGYDNAPNNMLYLLHLRGHRYSKDHEPKRLKDILSEYRPTFLISNDSLFTEKVRAGAKDLKPVTFYRNLSAFEIVY